MIEVQVGEDHVGHVVRGDAAGAQAVQQLTAPVLAVVDRPGPGVDQDDPVAGADQETAEGELRPPSRVQMPAVAGPRVGIAGLGTQQRLAGDLIAVAVEDRQDLELSDLRWPAPGHDARRSQLHRLDLQHVADAEVTDLPADAGLLVAAEGRSRV